MSTSMAHVPVERVGPGERDFVAFFRGELPRLTGYCSGLLGDAEAAADVAQEALTRTYARWFTVREPRAYAYLVATNLVRGIWRTRARDRSTVTDLAARSPTSTSQSDQALRDLIERLPERLRIVTLLHYYADLPIGDVARLVHRPQGTVRQRLHEARRRLSADIQEASRA